MMESLPEPDTAEGPEPNEAADAEDAYDRYRYEGS
jgi:hypothetical protein